MVVRVRLGGEGVVCGYGENSKHERGTLFACVLSETQTTPAADLVELELGVEGTSFKQVQQLGKCTTCKASALDEERLGAIMEQDNSVLLEHNGVVENKHVKLAWVASPSED
eukprot:151862-Amphidinium_carterae.1